ncbi:hypothetical protein E2C01_066590 [Portunus trituberculatus]|uniref:Uncharacterized protein n=1 Tax=Portunus trituberculatus TaxID=210409 RepID=A0A5B7HHH9_PORTR|nr:hypothetical protein [Portunus trituberculatus]
MSGSPNKRKSEVIWSDYAYSVATEGDLGPLCQPEIGLEIENKRPCLGLLVPAATTKPAEFHVDPAQRTMPVEDAAVVEVGVAALEDMDIVKEPLPAPSVKERHQDNAAGDQSSHRHVPAPTSSDRKQRRCLHFPAGHGKTTSELFSWFAALLKQHPDLQPLYKEGRNQPYITVNTDSSFYATLVTGFHGLKRRMVGQMPRPQLLGLVTGKVPSEVHLLGLGRQRVERYTPEPDLSQCLDKIKEGTKIPPRSCNCGGDHNAHSTLCTVRPRPQREPATDEVSQPRRVFCQAPPPQTNAWVTKPSSSAAGPHLSQPSCLTTGTLATQVVFLPLLQRTATVPPVPPKTVPQPGVTQELLAKDPTQQLMLVVSALAAKVDNLSAAVSGLSNEFATFKNQQHTVCSGTSTVAPTPSPASSAQRDQGESDVCQHSLYNPPKKKDNAAGQCATDAAPSSRMDTPTKPVKGATRQSRSPSGMGPASPASESKSPEADFDEDAASEWTLVSHKKRHCLSPNPAWTASPEPDQGHLMAAIQMLTEQMSRLAQEVDSLKTQMQHHRDER